MSQTLVGALTMGATFFMSPIAGVLSDNIGIRVTAVLGGCIASLSLVITSFVTRNIYALYIFYGALYGTGTSFAFTPSLAILGHYFEIYLGLVNGIVTVGGSIFTVFIPPLVEYILHSFGLPWLFRVLAVISFGIVLCSLVFKNNIAIVIIKPAVEERDFLTTILGIINVDIWQIRKYKIWALSFPVALFGYFVPYVHIRKYMEDTYTDVNFNTPLQCIAFSSTLGGLIFGYLADWPEVESIVLQQVSFFVFGALLMVLAFITIFPLMVLATLTMGFFDGALIALIGPIAFDYCGTDAAQAIGCALGIAAVPLSIGPSIAGILYNLTGSYKIPFMVAGLSPILGASLMFGVRIHPKKKI